jgi:hypothetical protein
MAMKMMLTWIFLLAACGGDESSYKPPIALSYDLKPGEVVHCENWFIWLGLPFANRETAVIFYQKHVFDCEIRRT